MLLQVTDLPNLYWLEIDLTLQAHAPPQRSHPLVVLEGVLKGSFESAGLDARSIKQLWHVPGTSVLDLRWQTGTHIPVRVQLFGMDVAQLPDWQTALQARFAPAARQNFDLVESSAWRVAHPTERSEDPDGTEDCWLDFLTPVPLPHKPGQSNTALNDEGFLHLCQTRLRKLFGREAELPLPPTIDTSFWSYWRTRHPSRSQGGHPMFLHGCIGPLHLSGRHLAAWKPWLALLAEVGMGERLSFTQGRFRFSTASQEEITVGTKPAPLRLRRPYVLDSDLIGAHLQVDNANLVVTHEKVPEQRLPLMRLSSLSVLAPIQLSSALLHDCANEGVPVILAAPGQSPLIVIGSNGEAKRNQTLAAHHLAWTRLDEASRVQVAAKLIDAKLAACSLIIRQRYQAGDNVILTQLDQARAALSKSDQLNTLRGWEGWAARHYYRWMGHQANLLGAFNGRRKHGKASDSTNVLLNFSYTLLRHRIAVSVRLAGLDPYLGILHEANGRHDALVSDLMEPWRPYIDRLLLRLINLRIIQSNALQHIDGQLRLSSQARARVVQEFTQLLEATPKNGGIKLAQRVAYSITTYRDSMLKREWDRWLPDIGSNPQPWTEDVDHETFLDATEEPGTNMEDFLS